MMYIFSLRFSLLLFYSQVYLPDENQKAYGLGDRQS